MHRHPLARGAADRPLRRRAPADGGGPHRPRRHPGGGPADRRAAPADLLSEPARRGPLRAVRLPAQRARLLRPARCPRDARRRRHPGAGAPGAAVRGGLVLPGAPRRVVGAAEPLDEDVVDAYWIGSDLLDRVDPAALVDRLTDRFRGQGGGTWREAAGAGAPHHSFQVFEVYPWLGLLREGRPPGPAVWVLDRCRIRVGEVLAVAGERVTVTSRLLAWDGARADRVGHRHRDRPLVGRRPGADPSGPRSAPWWRCTGTGCARRSAPSRRRASSGWSDVPGRRPRPPDTRRASAVLRDVRRRGPRRCRRRSGPPGGRRRTATTAWPARGAARAWRS